MSCPTFASVVASKQLNDIELKADLNKLKKWKPTIQRRSFAGNAFLYHFQMENLCDVKVQKGSFRELMENEEARENMWFLCNKYANKSRPNNAPLRLFELWRRMNGAVVFFRPTVAKYVYQTLGCTHVLDPTAGWGGRMLGAWALGISYTGFDINENLIPAYEGMVNLIDGKCDLTMRFENSLEADFSEIDYDCVLTSPPYYNLEVYPGMTPYESKEKFYKGFLIPLIDKCRKHIKRNGWVCFNISTKMYKELTTTFKYPECQKQIPMLQQKVRGIDKKDQVFCWR